MKLTTKQLYELRDNIRATGLVRADIYYNTLGGRAIAHARDRYGIERRLVIWQPLLGEDDINDDDLLGKATLYQLEDKP